jgi:hypothetical protein
MITVTLFTKVPKAKAPKPPDRSTAKRTQERVFQERDIPLRVRMELGSNEAIKQAVAGGLGLALLSRSTLNPDPGERELAELDVEGFPIMRAWYLVRPKGKELSVVAATFLEFLSEHLQLLVRRRYGSSLSLRHPMIKLRTYVYIDSLQPQLAAYIATVSQGFLPIPSDACLWVEVSPGMAVHRLTDIALKAARVHLAQQSGRARLRLDGDPSARSERRARGWSHRALQHGFMEEAAYMARAREFVETHEDCFDRKLWPGT